MYYVGVDLGGTNIAAGLVDEGYRLLAKASTPTGLPRAPEEIADTIYQLAARLLQANGVGFPQVESVGVGIPGTVNRAEGVVEYANNFGFRNVPLVRMLKGWFPCPVWAENDAKAAAWGEYLAGAGKGCQSMVAVTLGTGVGGGVILDGRLWDGCNNAAGELGHMVVERGGRPCTCGRRGCLEAYASATALVQRGREEAKKHPDSLLGRMAAMEPGLNGQKIFEAAAKGDEAANGVVGEFFGYLAEGVANIINILQPERLCIGGGLSGAGEQLLFGLRERVWPLVYSRGSQANTHILLAELGNDAGLVGAAGFRELYGKEKGAI